MADIELVIKIPEELYLSYKDRLHMLGDTGMDMIAQSISNGTPLPKVHGRLIDENKITKFEQIGLIIKDGSIIRCFTTDAPTIIDRARKRYGE